MRSVILALVLLAVAAAVLTMSSEPGIGRGELDVSYLIYMLLWLVLVGGAVMTVRERAKASGAEGPGIATSLAIWAGLFALAVLLYRGAWFWSGLVRLFGAAAPR